MPETIINLGNKLTVFQTTICETVVTKIRTLKQTQEDLLFYLCFLIMHVGGIYFTNHKTKDFLPKGAGLLNLSVSTLTEQKSHDSQIIFGDTHYNQEDYHRYNKETPSRHTTSRGRPLKVP